MPKVPISAIGTVPARSRHRKSLAKLYQRALRNHLTVLQRIGGGITTYEVGTRIGEVADDMVSKLQGFAWYPLAYTTTTTRDLYMYLLR